MTKAPATGRGARRDAAAAPKPGLETAAGHVAGRFSGRLPRGAAGVSAPPLRRAAARIAAPAATPTAA